MKADVMLIIEGSIAAILLFWIVRNPTAVNAISGASTGAIVGSFKQLIGGSNPNGA